MSSETFEDSTIHSLSLDINTATNAWAIRCPTCGMPRYHWCAGQGGSDGVIHSARAALGAILPPVVTWEEQAPNDR
ncbi:MAG TPA: hypothetical protein VKQ30_20715 [Ktedonobacterales bacterium]|nr:hypothetical protein [Ktedonobacterales bacterium]